MGPSGRFTHELLYWIVGTGYIQVMYMGRAPRTKETLPDFRERDRVTQHPRVFPQEGGSTFFSFGEKEEDFCFTRVSGPGPVLGM